MPVQVLEIILRCSSLLRYRRLLSYSSLLRYTKPAKVHEPGAFKGACSGTGDYIEVQ